MKFVKYLLLAFAMLSCTKSSDSDGSCEVVINAQGPGFLKVINKLNSKVDVFLPEYAFSAILRGNTCEIYGLNTGSRKAEISICTDSDCNDYSVTKNVTFKIENGKTYIIELTADFFGI